MEGFIGRKQELQRLEEMSQIGSNIIVIRGRRRIGKSRLVQEYAKNKRFLEFSGLAPEDKEGAHPQGGDAQAQRDHFANLLVHQLKITPCTFKNWHDAFMFLSHHLTDEPTVIFFDEISWMAEGDPRFVAKLKVWWDTVLQKHSHIQLILCGSVSTWIEENIIKSTALFGRISLQLTLEELSLSESYMFLKQSGFKGSNYDILKILSVTGGVPWYLKQVNPQLLADENIRNLCFIKGGVLTNEFERIFNDLYKGDSEVYKKIVYALADGMKTLATLREELGYEQGGFLGKYVKNLCVAGFVTQHHLWSFHTQKLGKQSLYRLSDNYLRFYVKYIESNMAQINKGSYTDLSLTNLAGWQTIMGLQVENLLLKNRVLILKAIGLKPEEIVADNPYRQAPTKKHQGCQIDYLIQTHTKNLFICEFKYNTRELGVEIIREVQQKVDRLAGRTGFGIVPVLVHCSGVTSAVYEKMYFYRIIDINDIMEEKLQK